MRKLDIKLICKISNTIFVLYVLWFKEAYGNRQIILYSTVAVSTGIMILDMLQNRIDVRSFVPYGVLSNIIMCVYSLLFGMLWAPSPFFLVSAVKTYFSFSILCVSICYASSDESNIDWLINALVITSLICCAQVYFKGVHYPGYGYVMGPENNPNGLAIVLNLGLFAVAYRCKDNLKSILLHAALAAIFLLTIVGCGSRKGLIGAFVIILLWVYPITKNILSKGNAIQKTAFILLLVLIIIVGFGYFNQEYINSDSYRRMQSLGGEEGSSELRSFFYKLALDLFLDHPLFGVGLQQFSCYNSYGAYAHSTYAEAIADWGLIGCLLYFIPIIVACLRAMALCLSKYSNYRDRIILAFCLLELFLGIGTIFFYEPQHFIAWTVIFIYIHIRTKQLAYPHKKRGCKYVKDTDIY